MIQWDCTVTWVLPSWKHQGGTQDHGKITLEKGAKINCCNSLGHLIWLQGISLTYRSSFFHFSPISFTFKNTQRVLVMQAQAMKRRKKGQGACENPRSCNSHGSILINLKGVQQQRQIARRKETISEHNQSGARILLLPICVTLHVT